MLTSLISPTGMLAMAASIAFGFWKLLLLYWAVPLLTVFLTIRYMRNVAEHYAVEHENVLNESRTVLAPAWERWLIAPWGLNYHLEHHLYPSVTHGYFSGLFRDCTVYPDPDRPTAQERVRSI